MYFFLLFINLILLIELHNSIINYFINLIYILASTPASSDLYVYTDALQTNWQDWSWPEGAVVLTNPDPTFSGSYLKHNITKIIY